MYLCRELV